MPNPYELLRARTRGFFTTFNRYLSRTENHNFLRVVGNESKNIHVFPLFTVSGHHVRMDIYDSEDSIYKQLLNSGYNETLYREGLLSYQAVRELYIKSLMTER